MKPPTIYDVARLAGVSHQTVTRYLHGFEGIRPKTRERVAAALAELGYQPNAAARLLRTRRNNRIGVLADLINQSGPARILNGATELARQHGYVLDIVTTDGFSAESVSESLAVLTEHQVAGILATAQTNVVLDALRRNAPNVPMVIDVQSELGSELPSTGEAAGRCAAEHLFDLGHRRVGYLSGPTGSLAAQDRLNGFKCRTDELGGEIVWQRAGDWSPESGYAAWSGLSTDEREVTAVAAANDSMAIGLISVARATGLRVPEDLSVVGTDDLPEARYLLPPLSTVVMDFEGEGRVILAALLAQIEDEPFSEPIRMTPPYVVARDSTAAPRGAS
ncbi:MAG: LacI family DNA-binding transcriptional regulator [Catenulispora sp.]|nr:LacI family DNA-binding transcriptional regulator [Catenulispora sp.]